MKKIKDFIKTEIVLSVAVSLALISSFWNPPSEKYFEYIDFRVLGILLSLMLVMAGLQKNGVFYILGKSLVGKCTNTRLLAFALIFLCFFSSMLLTNDVALITFVPFAILTLKISKKEKLLIPVITAQTVAANLGSMMTPMGNPQNLYLYGLSKMEMVDFIKLMLPYTIVSGVLLFIFVLFQKKEEIVVELVEEKSKPTKQSKMQSIIYFIVFFLCIGTVLHLISWYIVLAAAILSVVLMDWELLGKVDYSLLVTFIGFFLFIGNMGELSQVREVIKEILEGREFLVSMGASQVISNVPAAILLSGFTKSYEELIVGTNVGGLGTLIASMASLISYKQLVNAYPEKKGVYFIYFTVMNLIFLGILSLVVVLL